MDKEVVRQTINFSYLRELKKTLRNHKLLKEGELQDWYIIFEYHFK